MAIDEARRMFRLTQWTAGIYHPDPFDPAAQRPQDVAEVWFAGAHGDVGGGHPEAESGLAKLSLLWMAGQAAAAGLGIDVRALERLGRGETKPDGSQRYCPADPLGPIHAQPAGGWWALEWPPKNLRYREWPARRSWLGRYLPMGEPRPIPDGAALHESVVARIRAGGYSPVNLAPDLAGYEIAATQAPA